MKKILSLSLVLALLLSALCILPASAEELRYDTNGRFSYVVYDDNTASIYSFYDKTATEVIIPEKIDGCTVTAIDDGAFQCHESITKVTLPDTITRIGTGAFQQTPLEEIRLSSNLEYIGDSAFQGCTMLSGIDLPEGLTYIGNSAFNDCCNAYFTEVTIPDSVTYIGYLAFSDCSRLKKFNMSGENLTYLGDSILLRTPFYNDTDNWKGGGLYCGVALLDTWCYNSASFKVKEGTRIIAERAFLHNYYLLKNVTLPDSVKYLGEYCFAYNPALTNVKLSDNIETIPKGAFDNCTNLNNVVIPEGVTLIDAFAFYCCTNLTNIKIPQSVTTFGDYSLGYNVSTEEIDGVLMRGDDYKSENLTIAGDEGSAAEEYASEHGFKFDNLIKYKDKVLSLLDISEENPDTGESYLAYYREGYEYYADASADEATPDYVLISAYYNGVADCEITEYFGDYVLYSPSLKYPGEEFGYHIYLPKTNEIYTLCEAFDMGLDGIYNVFTEGGIGELVGDVNSDDKLSIQDATLIQKHLAGLENLNSTVVADFNRDGKINIRDATAVQKRLAGLDFKEIEHTVLGITQLPHPTDERVSTKAIARSAEELMSILSAVTDNSGIILHDKQLDEEYFKDKNVVVVAEVLSGICSTKTCESVKSNGTALRVNLTNHYGDVCYDEVVLECVLIEVDKADTDALLKIEVRESTALICP